MIRCFALLAVALLAGACGHTDPGTLSQQQQTDSMWLTGKQAYEEICAGCHNEGVNGAPRTGDRDAWDGRSRLWEAVLTEHAKQGYGDMPARGGANILSDAETIKAADYMLTLTYPESHRD